jgi:hypothetical protein
VPRRDREGADVRVDVLGADPSRLELAAELAGVETGAFAEDAGPPEVRRHDRDLAWLAGRPGDAAAVLLVEEDEREADVAGGAVELDVETPHAHLARRESRRVDLVGAEVGARDALELRGDAPQRDPGDAEPDAIDGEIDAGLARGGEDPVAHDHRQEQEEPGEEEDEDRGDDGELRPAAGA